MTNKTVLENGVRLVSQSLDSAYSVCLGIWMEVGSRDEKPRQGGVSHFIEHMAFKGTQRRGALEVAREIDRLGGMANAFTSKEVTCFHARALPEHLPTVCDLLLDLVLSPAYQPEEIERERQVILQELGSQEDTPDELVHVLAGLNYWPEHPLGRPVLGTPQSVSALGRDEILAYLRSSYLPHRLVVAASGRLEHQELVELMAPSLSPLKPDPVQNGRTKPQARPGLYVARRELEQVHVALGLPAPPATAPERFTAALLNAILGGNMSSRLFQEVRERRGLAYAVYSFLHSYSDIGMLGVYLGVAQNRVGEALKVVEAELARLAQEPVSPQELSEAQDHLKGSILLAAENPEGRMSRLARNEYNFGRDLPLEEVIAQLEAVSMEDLSALAAQCLDRKQMGVTVLGAVDAEGLAGELGW